MAMAPHMTNPLPIMTPCYKCVQIRPFIRVFEAENGVFEAGNFFFFFFFFVSVIIFVFF
jgi:hypothetical protein